MGDSWDRGWWEGQGWVRDEIAKTLFVIWGLEGGGQGNDDLSSLSEELAGPTIYAIMVLLSNKMCKKSQKILP